MRSSRLRTAAPVLCAVIFMSGCSAHPESIPWVTVADSSSTGHTCARIAPTSGSRPVRIQPDTVRATTVCFYLPGTSVPRKVVLSAGKARELAAELLVVHPVRQLPHCAAQPASDYAQVWVESRKQRVSEPITVGLGRCSYVSFSVNLFGSTDARVAGQLASLLSGG